MAKMAPEKLAAIQALEAVGFTREDFSIEKHRGKRHSYTKVKFCYGITNESILERAEQLAASLCVYLHPDWKEDRYLLVSCDLPQPNRPPGLYVAVATTLRVTNLVEAATIAKIYREGTQARRAERVARQGYVYDFEVEQLELFDEG